MQMTGRSKYHSRKIVVGGETFDSQKEFRRFHQLRLLECAGRIENLKRQVKYELIPAQYAMLPDRKGKLRRSCVERSVTYIADFVYSEDGETVVEDVKGYKGGQAYAVFTIKRKLMLHIHGVKVKEI